MEIISKIGKNIKKFRELKNYTQEYMASQLEMTQGGYGKIERGDTDISLSKIESISKVLEISLFDIIGFDEKKLIYGCFTNNQNANQADVIIGNDNFERERKLYEAQITELKNSLKDKDIIIDLMKEKFEKK